MTLTLTTSGLVFSDDFTRANGAPGANWVIESGAWTIDSNRLRLDNESGVSTVIRVASSALPNRRDFHVQRRITRHDLRTYMDVGIRRVGGTHYQGDVRASNDGSVANGVQWYRKVGGGFTALTGVFGAGPVVDVPQRVTNTVKGSSPAIQLKVWVEGVLFISITDNSPSNDIDGGISINGYCQAGGDTVLCYVEDIVVCSDRLITVSGLPVGYQIRANGLTSAASDGTLPVVLDLQGTVLPVASLDVMNGATVVESATIVYGGDVFEFTDDTPPVLTPETPTLDTSLWLTQSKVTSSTYVGDPVDDLHASTQWQIAPATDPTFAGTLLFDSAVTNPGHTLTLTSFVALLSALPANTDMLIRARYTSVAGGVSDWSDAAAIAIVLAKPVLTTTPAETGRTKVRLHGSVYDGMAPHASSQWQVTTSADVTFATPLFNSGVIGPTTDQWVDALPWESTVLARVRYGDNAGHVSAWSDTVSIVLQTRFVYPPSRLQWHPTFVIGGSSFAFVHPVTRWIPGGRTIGSSAKSASGVPGNETKLRRYTLAMNLRFTEDEWPLVREFLQKAQTGRSFSWYPNREDNVSASLYYTVTLDSPRIADPVRTTRESGYLKIFTIPIVLASRSPFRIPYFTGSSGFHVVDLGVGPEGVYDGAFVGFSLPYTVTTAISSSRPVVITGIGVFDQDGVGTTNGVLQPPLILTFDVDIESFAADIVDSSVAGNFLIAYDIDNVELGRVEYTYAMADSRPQHASLAYPGIRKIELRPSTTVFGGGFGQYDSVGWCNMVFTYWG